MFSLTEHGPEMPDSPHPCHFGNRKILPRHINGVAMLRGAEGNISPLLGGLDISEHMYDYLDFVIARFHEPVFEPSDVKTHTQAVINTFESGRCQVLGHPGNPNYPLHYSEVIRAAKDNNVLIEINNSSFTHSRIGSAPYCQKILELVDTLDWKVCFASDAHVAYDVGNCQKAVELVQKIGFPEERIINRDAKSFLAFLAEHNKAVAAELSGGL